MSVNFDRRSLVGSLSNISNANSVGGTPAVQTLNLGGTTIDNSNNSYSIRVWSSDWPSGGSKTLEIKTVQITYTIIQTD